MMMESIAKGRNAMCVEGFDEECSSQHPLSLTFLRIPQEFILFRPYLDHIYSQSLTSFTASSSL